MPTCAVITDIQKDCLNNQGGIYGAWIIQQEEISSVASTGGSITAITLAGLNLFENYFVRRNTSNYTEDTAVDLINGSTFVTQTINLVFHRRDAAKSQALKILGAGQQYLAVVILDANGLYWYIPYAQVTATGEGSGTARADGSKYTLTLVAENESLCDEINLTPPATLAALGIVLP